MAGAGQKAGADIVLEKGGGYIRAGAEDRILRRGITIVDTSFALTDGIMMGDSVLTNVEGDSYSAN